MKLKFTNGILPEPWVLATPSWALNRALGGGLKSGRFHLLSGPKGSTKSTIALKMLAEAQRMGKTVAYIDAEKTYETGYAAKCGVDVASLKYIRKANIVEDMLEVLVPELMEGSIDVAVVDSLSVIQLRDMITNVEDHSMAADSRSQKYLLLKLLNVLEVHMQIIFISHSSFQKVGQQFMLKAAVGTKTEHLMSTMINFVANTGSNNFRESDNAQLVKWRIDKAKQDIWPLNGQYYFHKPTAILDYVDEVATIAKDLEIITGSAWKQFGDRRFHGDKELLGELRQEPALLNAVLAEISTIDTHTRHLFAAGVDYSMEELI